MKNYSFAALLLCLFITTSQAQHIPDGNFAASIRQQCPSCIDVSDNLLPAAQSLTYLNVSNQNISDLTGIGGFVALTYLDCSDNQLTSLPALPNSLSWIFCNNNQLTSLPALPNSLYDLNCAYNQLSSMPALPSGLNNLFCQNNNLTSLSLFAATQMFDINCSNNLLTSIVALPDTLWSLNCSNNMLISLPELSDSLTTLNCNDNPNLECLPFLPYGMYDLQVSNTLVNCLPNYTAYIHAGSSPFPLCDPLLSNCFIYPEITGKIFTDDNNDCTYTAAEPARQNYMVAVENISSNAVYYDYTDANGDYLMRLPLGDYIVTALPNNLFGSSLEDYTCQNNIAVNLNAAAQVVSNDFPIETFAECSYLQVDIATAFIRRCLPTPYYTVSYCNQGNTEALNSYIDISLDPNMVIDNTSLPYITLANNSYRFDIGTVAIGQCGNFQIHYTLDPDCNSTILGQTHCVEATIYPAPMSCLANTWNGAIIEVEGECQQDSVAFSISNTGIDMPGSRPYYVIEDNLILRTGNFQLINGETDTVKVPALPGKTYRIEALQESGFPLYLGDSIAWAAVEGCVDSLGLFNTGWVTVFNTNSSAPNVDIDCRENGGSYDPNDKTGYPIGYGNEHFIAAGQALDYHIRFQNTGTDTAFTVVILDTLSPTLDPTTIEWGAASHDYTYEILPDNVIRWTFNHINLVDSNTNELLSHGFVGFRIRQQPNLAVGTLIHNTAAIYFDLNAPIITNTTYHEIGEDFIGIVLVPVQELENNLVAIQVMPNPFRDMVRLQVQGNSYASLQFSLFDALGKEILQLSANQTNTIELHRNQLPQGLYFYRLESQGQLLSTGKLMAE